MAGTVTRKLPTKCPHCRRPTNIRTLESYAAGVRIVAGYACRECGRRWAPGSTVVERVETSDGIDVEWPDP